MYCPGSKLLLQTRLRFTGPFRVNRNCNPGQYVLILATLPIDEQFLPGSTLH